MPVRRDILEALGAGGLDLSVGAVCVYHAMIETAARALEGSTIPVAAVSAGFPAGLSPLPERVREVAASVAAGAHEIDIVVNRGQVLTGEFTALYDEVRAFREAAAQATLKTIVGAGEGLGTETSPGELGMCGLREGDFGDRGHDHAPQPLAPEDLVDGRSHRDQPLERYLRPATPGPARARQLQECLAPAAQAAPRHGRSGSQPA